MGIKIYKKSQVTRNLVLYVLGSLAYMRVLESIHLGIGPLEIDKLYEFSSNYRLLFWASGFTTLLIIFYRKASKYLLPLYFGAIFVLGIRLFLIQLDKVLLFLTFAHLIFSYYLYVFWNMELKEAIFNPHYNLNDMGEKTPLRLDAKVKIGEIDYWGKLTNWDETGFFILFNEGLNLGREKAEIEISFEGNSFTFKGEIISKFGNGNGIRVKKGKKSQGLGWDEFFAIIYERGLKSSLI